ncbi:hypothetical protein CN918_25445 [Priestia megaterium]|nr:hypothetical protein CN918_25445 [Priestia megaterium]
MDLPFNVTFIQKSGTKVTEEQVKTFVKNERDLYKMSAEDMVTVTENLYLSVDFQCEDYDGRFHMDGLDTLPAFFVQEHKEGIFLEPTNGYPQILFDNVNKRNRNLETHQDGYYPFIPGFYRIRVVVEEVSYYTWLKVLPKQINESQWTTMRDEIEHTLRGLAQDLVHHHTSIDTRIDLPLPIDILRKLFIIQKNYSKWSQALISIQENPRMHIQKEYGLTPVGRAKTRDAKSIRYQARHPESRDFVYEPSRVHSHDLIENQWIQKILRFLIKEINNLLESLFYYQDKVKEEIADKSQYFQDSHEQIRLKKAIIEELHKYEKSMRKIRSLCLTILQTEWMQNVTEKTPTSIPHTMKLDHRYRQMHNLYRTLKNDNISVTFDNQYDYYWKRTDLLYEIWGFIQVIRGLQSDNVGFKVVDGWIFGESSNSQSIKVPFLEAGTRLVFKRDNITLHLVYDEYLPSQREDTDDKNPTFTTGTHTRPDVRMDIYDEYEFIGHILMDFKYRPIWHIWAKDKVKGNRQNDTMKQLISYVDNTKSPYIYQHSRQHTKSVEWGQQRPVFESWAIYPSNPKNGKASDPLENYGVRLMELTPEIEQDHFRKSLAEAIQKVLDGNPFNHK